MKSAGFSMKAGTLCVLTIASAMALPTNAFADEVTLKSADGTVNLTGEFVAFEDNSYIVRTPLGDLRIAASRVTCEGDACPTFEVASADVEIIGSETVGLGLMPLLLEGYAGFVDAEATITNANGGQTMVAELVGDAGFGDELGSFLVESSGSNDAFSELLNGTSQVGMSSRRIRPDEARALRDAGAGSMISAGQEFIVAVDSLVVVTHPDNPVGELSFDQLGKIYAGQITNWQEVGGADQEILVVDRPEDSGARAVIAEAIFDKAGPSSLSEDAVQIATDNNEVSAIVNANENAIGFVGYAFQRGTKPLTLINDCGIAVTPDAFSARTEEYPLQRRMYLYTRADRETPEVTDFLSYAASPAADAVISKSGFIGLGVDRRLQSIDGAQARFLTDPSADVYEAGFVNDMLSKMVDHDRLSTTFRFRTGSSKLDERGRIDMQRLADYLKENDPSATITFVGFTDDVGAFDANMALSQDRAAQVSDTFAEFIGDTLPDLTVNSTGFGEIAPAGCNVQDNGRRINRRVEVWIQASGDAG